jgi:hypothetical protein
MMHTYIKTLQMPEKFFIPSYLFVRTQLGQTKPAHYKNDKEASLPHPKP